MNNLLESLVANAWVIAIASVVGSLLLNVAGNYVTRFIDRRRAAGRLSAERRKAAENEEMQRLVDRLKGSDPELRLAEHEELRHLLHANANMMQFMMFLVATTWIPMGPVATWLLRPVAIALLIGFGTAYTSAMKRARRLQQAQEYVWMLR